jgi:hypothetical protein
MKYAANLEASEALNKINNTVYNSKTFADFRHAVIEDMADGSLHPSWPYRAVELAKKTHSLLSAILGDAKIADKVIRDSRNYDDLLKRLQTSTSETPHKQQRQTMIKSARELIATLSAMERRKLIEKNKPEPLEVIDPLDDEISDKTVSKKTSKQSAKSEASDEANK